jgi:hypothetical protein
MTDLLQREVGWIITKEHNELEGIPSRVGWGQLRVHAEETDDSFDQVIGRTIFMDKSLTEHMMPEEVRVRWRSFEDDGYPAFDGIVNINWLFDDMAYNIDRFNETDVGAVWVWYSVDDIVACVKHLKRKDWKSFATQGDQRTIPDSDGLWIQIYG